MKTFKSISRIASLLASLLGATVFMVSAPANAHTTKICWQDVGAVTTFYAGSYHSPAEGPSPIGGIIVDGFVYPFSGWIYPAALPAGAKCAVSSSGTGPAVVHYQTFTSSFAGGAHTISFTSTNVVQAPWGPFPLLTFGGGACADADFDGICNNVDNCPLDFNNDADGDGTCGNVDNCPNNSNPSQTDENKNGQGDACEGDVCGNGLVTGAEQCDDDNIAGGDGCSALCTVESIDSPPIANAGADQSVNEALVVTLNGSASRDPDGDPLTFAWTQIGGTGVVLSNATAVQPTFTSPNVGFGGETLSFSLTVTANGATSTDQVDIRVVNVNHPPVADADDDQSIVEGSAVSLSGTDSYDVDSDPITYSWVQVRGPAVTLNDASSATPSFMAPIGGGGGAPGVVATLVFQLTVSDALVVSEDTVTVEVTNVNNDPIAEAETDKTVSEKGAVQLNGSSSSDPDSDTLTYAWLQTAGPAVTLYNEHTAVPYFTAPFVSPGGADLTFELTVDDGYGGVATDIMLVHVQNANDPPNASLAQASTACMWPPNHKHVAISILGVSDPEDNATITINTVTQDEPTNAQGDGDTAVDAVINADGTVLLRAERSGNGNGRVYTVNFTASDLEGSDSGSVRVCVPHSKKSVAVDSGSTYDSTK